MATKVNAIESDRGRSMSAEDDMMFMMGSPFEDVSYVRGRCCPGKLRFVNGVGSPRPSYMTMTNLLVGAPLYHAMCATS